MLSNEIVSLVLKDVDFPLHTLVPPLQGLSKFGLEEMASQPFIPLDVRGSRQFIISLRYGNIVDKKVKMKHFSCLPYSLTLANKMYR